MKKLLLLFFIFCAPLHANAAMTGSVTISDVNKNTVYTIKRASDGKEVFKDVTGKNEKITVQNLPAGIYTVESKDVVPFYVTIPTALTKEDAEKYKFRKEEGIPDDSGKLSYWNLHYTVWNGHGQYEYNRYYSFGHMTAHSCFIFFALFSGAILMAYIYSKLLDL